MQRGHQPPKVVDLAGEQPPHLGQEQLEVVGEPQRGAGELDGRAELRGQRPLVPGDAKLAQQPGQRPGARAFGSEVGQGVQSDVEGAAALPVEGVQPADGAVPLQDADALAEVGQANAGRQPGHAGPDDDRVVHGRRGRD